MRNIRYILPQIFLCVAVAMASTPQKTEGLWFRVLKFLGVTSTSANLKGDDNSSERIEDPTTVGDIWVYKVDLGVASTLKQNNFRSPIFHPSGRTVFALVDEKVVKIDVVLDGAQITASAPTELVPVPGIRKLIAVDKDAPDQVLVLRDTDNDNCPSVAVLNLSRRSVDPLPQSNSKEDRGLVAYLTGSRRELDDGTKLEVKLVPKSSGGATIQATDVFLKRPGADAMNISNCPAVNCGQPSISNDRKFVVFVGKL